MNDGGTRGRVAHEAARLMYEEGVKQYFTAKRIAARRLFGPQGSRRLRFRPADLPSNGEIRAALLEIAELSEGDRRTRRLFAMRVVALETLRALEGFEPRLIGSVSTGHVRRGSDIDLHVFSDTIAPLEARLRDLGWTWELERVSILKGGKVREYTHVHVADVFAVELTVYERSELRVRPRSSTDGKPIVRLTAAAVEALLAEEHLASWRKYQLEGVVDGLDEVVDATDDEGGEGRFESLLTESVDEARIAALLAGGDDEDEGPGEALPGFEDV